MKFDILTPRNIFDRVENYAFATIAAASLLLGAQAAQSAWSEALEAHQNVPAYIVYSALDMVQPPREINPSDAFGSLSAFNLGLIALGLGRRKINRTRFMDNNR